MAQTLCEPLNWRNPADPNRVTACQGLLEALEQAGIVTLPRKPIAQTALFKEYFDRYHHLGYRQLLGLHLRYFLLDRHERPLAGLPQRFGELA